MEFLMLQFKTFLMMTGFGFLLGLFFDLYQVFLKRNLVSKYYLALLDILFGITAGVFAFFVLLCANHGDLRFFVFVSIFLGLFLYFRIIRKMVLNR
ncbi:MAG TPA: spore cortex biosynthesis protein YabQ [Halanaerobiales bacterium]|nr:spore cortex biosynthesis protein YabQ [Halanaerobiales bacterium]